LTVVSTARGPLKPFVELCSISPPALRNRLFQASKDQQNFDAPEVKVEFGWR